MIQILIIDDDRHISEMLTESLTAEGYAVSAAFSGTEALTLLSQSKPDLILLDLMLPGLTGEELLPKIKDIPVIVVSAKADVADKVGLLLGGAADYMTKPFEMQELLARIAVQLRKNSDAKEKDVLRYHEITLSNDTRTVKVNHTDVKLTRTEYAILKLLMQNPGQVLAKSVLLDRISADTPDCTENSLKTHVSKLRGKLRSATGRDCVEAVWGIGFRLAAES